jgi:UDP-2,3-diacylglucosamine pyrophosphatase LpxH
MPSHDSLLTDLLAAFPNEVFLVGQYADPRLGLGDEMRVFVPDAHWMSRRTLQRFAGGYEFNDGTTRGGKPLFGTMLDLLEDWKLNDASLEVYQLGDSFDLWREVTSASEDAQVAYDRLRNDPLVQSLADRLVGLGTKFIRGNHDAWLKSTNHGLGSLQDVYEPAGGKIFVTHGHRYDNIEMILPDHVKDFFVQLASTVRPRKLWVGAFSKTSIKKLNRLLELRRNTNFPKNIYPMVEPEGAIKITSVTDPTDLAQTWQFHLDVRDFSHGSGIYDDFDHLDYVQFGDNIFAQEAIHPTDHTLYVIGHTHHARLLVDETPFGKPLVIMDCGGWIEWCHVKQTPNAEADVVPSAQVGVQQGNEVRIYQLGGGR